MRLRPKKSYQDDLSCLSRRKWASLAAQSPFLLRIRLEIKKMAKDELSSRLKKFASTTEQYADDAFMNYYATRGD